MLVVCTFVMLNDGMVAASASSKLSSEDYSNHIWAVRGLISPYSSRVIGSCARGGFGIWRRFNTWFY